MDGPEIQNPARPRLLTSTGPLLLSPVDWALDVIADAGYDGAEVLVAHRPDSRDPDALLEAARQSGIDIPVIHGPYMLLLRRVLGAEYRQKTLRSLQLAADIGATTMVAHAPFRWERKARGWAKADATGEGATRGVAFAMENLFPLGGRTFSSAVTAADLDGYDNLVFDTSHFAVAGIDLFQAWDALADRVVHMHLSDNFGNGKDSHAPLGTGVLPLQRFIAHVGRSGWSGTITLELDCRPYLDTRDSLVAFLARERVKAEQLLDGTADLDAPRTGRRPEPSGHE